VLLKHLSSTIQNIEMELNRSYRLKDDSVISNLLYLALVLAFVVGTAQLTALTTVITLKTKTARKKVAAQQAGTVCHNGNVDTSCLNPPKDDIRQRSSGMGGGTRHDERQAFY